MTHERLLIPVQERDQRLLADLLGDALGLAHVDCFERFSRLGWENFRMLRRDGKVAGGLGIISFGHWFGGQSVPAGGITVVGVAPSQRGKGAALAMMVSALREQRQRGLVVSSLYPATQTLYRRAGYEIAGSRHELRLALRDIPPGKHECDVRPLEPRDAEAVADLYQRRAVGSSGPLDRNAFIWRRVREPRDGVARGFMMQRGNKPLAYLFYRQKPQDHGFDMMVTDMACADAEGAQALLSFLGDHRSMGHEAFWFGVPSDPLLARLPEQRYRSRLFMHWMLRIVDVAGALAARGYPDGLKAQLAMEVRDPQLPENQGRYDLEIVDGRAIVHAPDGSVVDGGVYVAARGADTRRPAAHAAAMWAVTDAQTARAAEQKRAALAKKLTRPPRRSKKKGKDDEEPRPPLPMLTDLPAELRREASAAGKRLPSMRTPNDPVRAAGGLIRLDVRGLAMIYSGHLTPLEALATGLIEPPRHAADEQALTTAAAVFAGSTPWLADMF